MVFQRAGHGADPHPPITRKLLGAGGRQDQIRLGQGAAEQGKLAVIAGQDADFAEARVKKAKRAAGDDLHGAALKTGHDLLVLNAAPAGR